MEFGVKKTCVGSVCRRAVVGASALLATAVAVASAMAQDVVAPVETAQAASQRSYSIAPQPLASALVLFGQQSGRQITVDADLVRGLSTPGVQRMLTTEAALRQLLAGTGLTFSTAGATIALQRQVPSGSGALQLDPVRVQAGAPAQAEIGNLPPPYAGGAVARGSRVGLLGERDYMDTPFSTTSYTRNTIQNQQALTLIDVLAVDPTLRAVYPQGSNGDRVIMRGFQVLPSDMSFNGLYGINPDISVGVAGIERVEVFRGPSAMLSGMAPSGAVGGTFNLVPKRATDEDITQATARYLTNSQLGGALDVGRRFGPDKVLGVRANAAFTGGNTEVANNNDNLLELTLGVDYRGTDTRLDFDIGYQKRNTYATRLGTFLAPNVLVPAAPDARNNLNQPWERSTYDDLYGMLRLEHDFVPNFTGFLKVGGRHTNRNVLSTFPTITSMSGATTNSGATQSLVFLDALSADAGARGRFETGPIRHELAVSATYLQQLLGARNTGGFAGAFANNLYNPIVVNAPNVPGAALTPPAQTSQTVLTSIGFIDALSIWNDKVQLIGGVRGQRVQISNYSPITGQTTAATPGSDQSAWTPAVSLVVRPIKELSVYGNYIEALEQGPVAGAGTLNAGQTFPASVSRQFEFGVKADLGTFGATVSAFQITRPSSFTSAGVFSVDGQQRNRGIELTAFGEPLPGFRPLGGFTVLDPVLTNTASGINNGKTAPGASRFLANLGFEWDVPGVRGVTLSSKVLYTGQAYIDQANAQSVPAWTRVDLGARYTFERPDGKPVSLRANVINVGNNNYWVAASGFMNEALPRTFLLSLTADF